MLAIEWNHEQITEQIIEIVASEHNRKQFMKPDDLKLFGLLEIDESAGLIRFKDRRLLVFDADALGLLRKELIESLGLARARRILTRFSYARGYHDAMTMKDLFPWDSEESWAQAGRRLHALEGMVNARLHRGIIDKERKIVQFEGEWINSFEAEQHLKHIGQSDIPVCWTIAGYATGYITAVMGRRVYYVEQECIGKGDQHCTFIGKSGENDQEDLSPLIDNYREENFHSEITTMLERLEERSQNLSKQQEKIRRLESQLSYLQDAQQEGKFFEEMVGVSKTFSEVLKNVDRVAGSDATVLIRGETGTGKELIARSIHSRSLRNKRPMIAVNCAALPSGLVESELFGHEKGAFTGADQRKPGRFELADGGTIFLDEVGEIPLETQAKLLRVLQQGEFERLGSTKTIKVDVRVLAATNQPLEKLVAEGKYRADLYYRLNVFPINIPPLRERGEDVVLLTYYFAQKFRARFKKRITAIDEDSLAQLQNYSFPGNIRELEHMIERAVLISNSETLKIDLPLVSSIDRARRNNTSSPKEKSYVTFEDKERSYIEQVLIHCKGQVEGKGGAAEILDLPPSTLRSRMKKLGIKIAGLKIG